MAARVGSRPSQLAATNNIKIKLQYWQRKNRKTTKQSASADAVYKLLHNMHNKLQTTVL